MTCGIYMITNKKTGQKYVGQSIDIEDRWGRHCRKRTENSSYVDRAIEKYGKDNFRINVITKLPPDKKLLSIHEKYWIKFYNTFEDDFHYNLTPGGETVMLGRHHTEESKKRMSEVKLGEQNPFYNKKHTEESEEEENESDKEKEDNNEKLKEDVSNSFSSDSDEFNQNDEDIIPDFLKKTSHTNFINKYSIKEESSKSISSLEMDDNSGDIFYLKRKSSENNIIKNYDINNNFLKEKKSKELDEKLKKRNSLTIIKRHRFNSDLGGKYKESIIFED